MDYEDFDYEDCMDCIEGNMLGGDNLQEWHDEAPDTPQHYVYINGVVNIICDTEETAHTLFLALQKARTVRIEK